MVFICVSLVPNDVEYFIFFICLLVIYLFLSVSKGFCLFLISLSFHYWVTVLYILFWIHVVRCIGFGSISSHSVSYLFIFLMVSFEEQKFHFQLHLANFCAFCVLSKKSSPIFRLRIYSMFSSQSFISLAFRFRFMAHLPEITFCFWCEVGAEDHFFPHMDNPFLALLVVKTSFSCWIVLVHWMKSVGSIPELCSVPWSTCISLYQHCTVLITTILWLVLNQVVSISTFLLFIFKIL